MAARHQALDISRGTGLADGWAADRRAELDAGRLRVLVAALRIPVETTPEARDCITTMSCTRAPDGDKCSAP